MKSRLHQMTQTTPTCLWNDSAAIEELKGAVSHGAAGATCNPAIAVTRPQEGVGQLEAPALGRRQGDAHRHGRSERSARGGGHAANAAALARHLRRQERRNSRLPIQTDLCILGKEGACSAG